MFKIPIVYVCFNRPKLTKKTFEYIKKRGTRPFDYNINIEIENELTPSTWKNKEI